MKTIVIVWNSQLVVLCVHIRIEPIPTGKNCWLAICLPFFSSMDYITPYAIVCLLWSMVKTLFWQQIGTCTKHPLYRYSGIKFHHFPLTWQYGRVRYIWIDSDWMKNKSKPMFGALTKVSCKQPIVCQIQLIVYGIKCREIVC